MIELSEDVIYGDIWERPNMSKRDRSLAAYHHYETASGALQLGIVLASAEIITGMALLAWLSGVIGIFGLGFMSLGLWAPNALDFLLHASAH